jgi:hypothetical protein
VTVGVGVGTGVGTGVGIGVGVGGRGVGVAVLAGVGAGVGRSVLVAVGLCEGVGNLVALVAGVLEPVGSLVGDALDDGVAVGPAGGLPDDRSMRSIGTITNDSPGSGVRDSASSSSRASFMISSLSGGSDIPLGSAE